MDSGFTRDTGTFLQQGTAKTPSDGTPKTTTRYGPRGPMLTPAAVADIERMWRETHDLEWMLLQTPFRWHAAVRILCGGEES